MWYAWHFVGSPSTYNVFCESATSLLCAAILHIIRCLMNLIGHTKILAWTQLVVRNCTRPFNEGGLAHKTASVHRACKCACMHCVLQLRSCSILSSVQDTVLCTATLTYLCLQVHTLVHHTICLTASSRSQGGNWRDPDRSSLVPTSCNPLPTSNPSPLHCTPCTATHPISLLSSLCKLHMVS